MPLNSLTRGSIEAWAARLPVSDQTIAQAARYLSTMLDAAVDDGLIASNPARRAKRPKVEPHLVVPFTDTEVEAFRDAAPAPFRVAFALGWAPACDRARPRASRSTGSTSCDGSSSWIASSSPRRRATRRPVPSRRRAATARCHSPTRSSRRWRSTAPDATGYCYAPATGAHCAASTSGRCGGRCVRGRVASGAVPRHEAHLPVGAVVRRGRRGGGGIPRAHPRRALERLRAPHAGRPRTGAVGVQAAFSRVGGDATCQSGVIVS
jgi:hypothetical protein